MRHKNKKNGFTLLEIIVVIIIVGILASLALPIFFDTLEFSRSTEALNALGSMRRGVDYCSMMSGIEDYTGCDSLAASGVTDPGPNGHFSYTIDPGAVPGSIIFIATRNLNNGGDGFSTVELHYMPFAGSITRIGTGVFSNIK